MKKVLKYALLWLCVVMLAGCGEDPVIEPVSPVIKGQSVLSGSVDITAEPQAVLILFDRDVVVNDASLVTLEPTAPLEVTAEGKILTISILEKLAYKTDYTLTIGAGAVADAQTDGLNLERVITFRTEEGPYVAPGEPTMKLVSRDALPIAQELYSFIWSVYGKGVLSGAMATGGWDLNECEWVNRYAGAYPVVAAFDYQYLHRSPSDVIDYSNLSPVDKWWSEGGVVAIDWHWMVPRGEGSKQYTYLHDETTLTVKNMLTEGTWEYAQMMRDFKKVADMLLLIQAQNIPVLWRPLPETQNPKGSAVGNAEYYWWSGVTADEYKALWCKMFDYFSERGVKNLIWVWTSQIHDIRFYPGEEYVDVVALDLYNQTSAKDVTSLWNQLDTYFPHKIVALGEMGNLPTIGQQLSGGVKWGYFAPRSDFSNDFTEGYNHSSATIDWWRRTFADERVLTRTSISVLKSYQAVRALR